MNEEKRTRFLSRLAAILPKKSYLQAVAAHQREKPTFLLVLPWRIAPEEACAQLSSDGIEARLVWRKPPMIEVASRNDALAHPLVAEGALFAMGLSSAAVASALAIAPGERLLDLCAAPGGKLLAACALLGSPEAIEIEAIERVPARFHKLRAILARAGVRARLHLGDARSIARKRGHFERVLVDAPCSTEAQLRLDRPESLRYWSERKIAEQRRKQIGLLRAGLFALAAGGKLVYSTCSYAPEENESVIEAAIKRAPFPIAPDRWLPPPDLPTLPALCRWKRQRFSFAPKASVRILPGPRTEAMFLSRLQREK